MFVIFSKEVLPPPLFLCYVFETFKSVIQIQTLFLNPGPVDQTQGRVPLLYDHLKA